MVSRRADGCVANACGGCGNIFVCFAVTYILYGLVARMPAHMLPGRNVMKTADMTLRGERALCAVCRAASVNRIWRL